MEVDRQVERLGADQERLERRIVEEAAVGGAVHQDAVEAEVPGRAFQPLRRRCGGEQGRVGEAAVARGVAGAGLGQGVVVGAGEVDAGRPCADAFLLFTTEEEGEGHGGPQELYLC